MTAPSGKTKPDAKAASVRAERRIREQRQAKMKKLMVLGGAVLIALVVVVGLIVMTRDDEDTTGDKPEVVAATALDASIPRDGRVLGDPNAPVTLVEWADYQCPFCAIFNSNMMPQLIEEYVKTGKVKVEFRDLPFLDSASGYGESDMAAEAAACAADQGKFWEMHDTIFVNHNGENEGAYSKERLTEMASLIGLDMDKFNTCFKDRTHKDEVAAMQAEAVGAGISSTPTIIINGTRIQYTGKYADLKADIEAALAG